MPDTITPRRAENKFGRRQPPSTVDNDQYTPRTNGNAYPKKSQAFYIDTKDDHQPMDNDPPPFRSYSPPIRGSFTPSTTAPEMYHLKAAENNHEIRSRHQSPIVTNNNRITPIPLGNFSDQKPEMYHLKTSDEPIRRTPSALNDHPKTIFNEEKKTHFDDHEKKKPTMYFLMSNQENLPVSRRTPTPPILESKRSQPAPYETVRVRPEYPPALLATTTNTRHISLTHSKASESIQRSMNKYRFGGH
ncbi:unnamed protein product [Rotaria socialis]|uniref:Uncharacterized protein n=1 Tax=Rotaria socialis TaxID=392032 RepID=A0A817NU69_9BILA|nr:unnamed protein product [Rotaria socialis]CAF3316276.1 unnamed protein product [Rotaria socialis]CAF3420645.1 unnamed protein product [Rotaria socialis]CAF3542517.1 unnamed protein product [Rotaria socialis]CAF3670742.1 unnamed protein product [Rotaria socialis]